MRQIAFLSKVVLSRRVACWIIGLLVIPLAASQLTAQAKPLKVFVLAGQSNMQGHAQVRTFAAMGLDPKTAPILEAMQTKEGAPIVCEQVWISAIGSSPNEKFGKLTAGYGPDGRETKIGPEFTFGIYMHKLLNEPILIIKTAWGGKSLHTDFRPPSAGPFEFSTAQLETFKQQNKDIAAIQAEKAEATGHYYRLMIEHVKHVLADIKRVYPDFDPQQGHELAGFVWFQGWNDMVDGSVYPQRDQPGGFDQYSDVLAHFIRDVRRDLSAPHLPFVIGVMGVGGPTNLYAEKQQREKMVHQNFRNAMAAPAALPEFKGNVATVLTENFWDLEVVALRKKEATNKPQIDKIRQQIKDQQIDKAAGEAAIEKLYGELFTPRELVILRESVSNADYHYMGSAKIMGQIGKAFAETLFELHKQSAPQK